MGLSSVLVVSVLHKVCTNCNVNLKEQYVFIFHMCFKFHIAFCVLRLHGYNGY